MKNNVILVYGINENIDIEKYIKLGYKVYLIEPRKIYIDKNKFRYKSPNFKLISRGLIKSNVQSNISFYSINNNYSFVKPNQLYYNKELISVTSLLNIFKEYKFQNIKYFYINLDVDNLNDILESLKQFDHIISNICFKNEVFDINSDKIASMLNNFKTSTKNDDINDESFIVYTNKNINISLPKICLYNIAPENTTSKFENYSMFINQYNIEKFEHEKFYNKRSILYYQWLTESLEDFFTFQTDNDNKYDILIQFNPKFFDNIDMFKIYYPIKDNELYLDKNLDIIYSNKNTMYMLYQILKSKYFTDYLDERKTEKPSLFKFFEKRYLYEYISKIFVIKNIN